MRKLLVTLLLAISLTSMTMAQRAKDAAEGYWMGEVMRNGKKWRVAANISVTKNAVSASVDFLDLDVEGVPFPATRTGDRLRLERPQPSGNPIVFDGKVKRGEYSGEWRGFGVEGRFSLRRSKQKRAASSYREVEVAFSNGSVDLSGTLLLPIGRKKFPAVVLVHGSSPNERGGYRSWARHIAGNGIAALIYDKRGSGRSTGDTRSASMENLADDALAGVRMLKLRRDIDAGKVGIAGHSQGGWIAPLAAARSGDVGFVIVSGAAAVTPAEQSIFHRAGVMRANGISEPDIVWATKLREKMYLLNRKILAGDADVVEFRAALSKELSDAKDLPWFAPAELPPELSGDLPPRGALELLFFDVSTAWPKVKVPVLAVWGDRDTVVPFGKSKSLIEEYLSRAGNRDVTLRVLPGVDHSNLKVRSDPEWDFPRSSSEYNEIIIDWVRERSAIGGRSSTRRTHKARSA